MRYQKFNGTLLFTGREMLPGNQVLITTNDGTVIDIVPDSEAGDDIQIMEGLICPGFVNAHCHLELSHLKGIIAEHTGLVPFLRSIPQLRRYPAEIIQAAMQQAAHSMLQNGIVAVGDICNTTDSLSIKQQSPLHWHNFIEAMGFTNDKAAERFAWSQNVYNQFEATMPGRNTIVPHSPYSVSQQLFSLINDASEGQISSIHSQESEAENEWYRHKTGQLQDLYTNMGINTDFFAPSGKSSLATFLPWLDKPKQLLLVHNVATTAEDIALMENGEWRMENGEAPITNNEQRMTNRGMENGKWKMENEEAEQTKTRKKITLNKEGQIIQKATSIPNTLIPQYQSPNLRTNQPTNQSTNQLITVLCPNANRYIQQQLPPVELLRQHGCTIALGTDSLASNHQLSIWAEIQTLLVAFPSIPLIELLQWGTLNGAIALGMQDTLGSFDKGKKPGVLGIGGEQEIMRLI